MQEVVTAFVSNERLAIYLGSDIQTADVSFTLIPKGGKTEFKKDAVLRFKGMKS